MSDMHTSAWARRARRRLRYWRAVSPYLGHLDRAAGVTVGACGVLALQSLLGGHPWRFLAFSSAITVVVYASLSRWRWW